MTQHGPPPGWPSAPASGEFGPGFTVAGDATLRSANGEIAVSPMGPPPAPLAGSAPAQGTVADAGAIYAPIVPLAQPGQVLPAGPPSPAIAAPIVMPAPVRRVAPKSRVPLLIGILVVITLVMGAIAFAVTRNASDDESEAGSSVPLPKKKKKAKKAKEAKEGTHEPAPGPGAAPAPPPKATATQAGTPTNPTAANTGTAQPTNTAPGPAFPRPTALPTVPGFPQPGPKPTSESPPPKKRTPREP